MKEFEMELHINAKHRWCIILLHFLSFTATTFAYQVDSPLFQPGFGALMKLTNAASEILIENIDNFKYIQKPSYTIQSGNIIASFVAPENGNYSFPSTCNGSTSTVVLTDLISSNINVKSSSVLLTKGFSYRLIFGFSRPSSCELGVIFPNGTKITPISKRYIYRAMDFYYSSHLLKQSYEFSMSSPPKMLEDFKTFHWEAISRNLSSFILTNRIFADATDKAVLFLGYFKTPRFGQTFRFTCEYICEANITSTTSDAINHRIKIDQSTNNVVSIELPSRQSLSLDILIVGKGQLDVYRTYRLTASLLYSLLYTLKGNYIKVPLLTSLNSSAIKVQLDVGTKLNVRDNWVEDKKYEIVCYRVSSLIHHFKNLTGSYPIVVVLSGLQNYTTYRCNAYYFGKISGSDYNIVSGFQDRRTAENVPSAPPTNIKATRPQFLTIKITWNAIPADNHEGVLYYALFCKKTDSDLWKKLVKTNRLYYTHKNLEESYYEYKVYGETGAGYGPSSAEITLMPILPRHKVEEARFSTFATSLHFTNKALKSYVSAVYKVTSVERCHEKCVTCQQSSNCRCLSFNLQHSSSNGGHKCEINHENAENFPNFLVQRNGYQYYTIF